MQLPAPLTRQNGPVAEIWCGLRRRWLAHTPEEAVRQGLLLFLLQEGGFPKALLRIEGGLQVVKMARRTDLLAYDRHGLPLLLCECKAPSVRLTPAVLEQALRYNLTVQAPFLLLTNGPARLLLRMAGSSPEKCPLPLCYERLVAEK